MVMSRRLSRRSRCLRLSSRAGVALLLLIACSLTFMAACRDTVEGSGQSTTEQRSVAPFTELSVRGAIETQVRIGQPQSVAVTGDSNVVPIIKTDVTNDRLTIGPEKSFNSDMPLRVEIVVPELDGLASAAPRP
jgi:hypothetical protein